MPLRIKILLSITVAALSGALAWYETLGPQPHLAWVVAAIAMIMVFGLWGWCLGSGGNLKAA